MNTLEPDSLPKVTRTAALLAAQLAKEPAARYMTADEIARDAINLAVSAIKARRKLLRQRNADDVLQPACKVLARYGATPFINADTDGMVLGARFASGTHRSGFRDVFYIA